VPERRNVPFNRPCLAGGEFERMAAAVSGLQISGNGPFTASCERTLEAMTGSPRALLTTSCTDALELAALLLGVGEGDEVIVPSFTFVSVANAFALRGAKPVFVDVRPDTMNLDHERLEEAVTPRTKAVVAVHYAGVACEMDAVLDVARRREIAVVEDAAHGLGGRWRGRPLGSFGALATLSFHETKNFTCGEGGALLVNDPALVERAEIAAEKGTDRRRFARGLVDKYTWVGLGSSFLPSDMLAAFLSAQLEARDAIQGRRRKVWERYRDGLAGWARETGTRLPHVPPHCEQAYHMFWMLLPTAAARTRLIASLSDRGVHAVFHYVPLHGSPMGRRFGGRPGQCPVAEAAGERLVRLPFFTDLSEEDQDAVIGAVREARLE
jgi:dTDP-4-amino-4,6-dideoxygalactose transaminase